MKRFLLLLALIVTVGGPASAQQGDQKGSLVPGGGFFIGDKSGQIGPMLEGLERGYALACLSYRLSGEARFPAAVNDVKAAIRFLRANAARYKMDPARADPTMPRLALQKGSGGSNCVFDAGNTEVNPGA